MKVFSPKVHGVLDYVVVLVFLAAPKLIGLAGVPALLSYTLAGVHLALTLFTNFPLGLVRLIPFPIHGWIELAVGPALVAVPWLLGFSQQAHARLFYIVAGVVIFVTWALTDYSGSPSPDHA